MKKTVPIICTIILAIVVCYICFVPNQINPNMNTIPEETTTSIEEISEEEKKENFENGVSGEETLNNMIADVVTYKADRIENMDFDSEIHQCTTATAITVVLYSEKSSIPLTQIEKAVIKTTGGTTIDADIKTFILNNKKAAVVFIKIEDNKPLESMCLEINTYDGKTETFELKQKENAENILKSFATPLGEATYGDLIFISGIPYYILQSGEMESYNFEYDSKTYSESVIGTILIPITNLFRETLSESNISVVFYNDEKTDFGTSIEFKLNDEENIHKYKDWFSGLSGELLTTTYRIETDNTEEGRKAVENKNKMIDCTWYKINTEENALLKVKGLPNNQTN